MNITCTIEITAQQLADQMTTALESRIGCWLGTHKLLASQCRNPKKRLWYTDPDVFAGQFLIEFTFDDPDSDDDGDHTGSKDINREAVAKGIEIMARDYPHHFADLARDNGDAITADLFLQCILFGKEVYA